MSPSSQFTKHLGALAILGLVCASNLSPIATPAHARTPILDAGFADNYLTDFDEGTDFAILPDQRILVATQAGRVYLVQNNQRQPTPALDITARVCDNWERGLLGIEADPNFGQNRYVYLYYTHRAQVPKTECETSLKPINRLSRFVFGPSNTLDLNSETVLIDHIPAVMGNHNGGGIRFGGDGYLYVGVGDSGTGGQLAQNLGELSGKILRIAPDGAIPPNNPFANQPNARRCGNPNGVPNGTGPCQEVFAYGLRNPWRISFKPNTSQFFINDVGQGIWEEVNDGVVNANYGWPMREGGCKKDSRTDCDSAPTFTVPLHAYDHRNGCSAVTGGAFVPQNAWIAPYSGNYLFADLVCGRIYALLPTANGDYTASLFGYDLGSVLTMRFSTADNALYYLTYNYYRGTQSELRRIHYVGNANLAPNISAGAAPHYGAAPLTVQFNAQGSDANNDPLRYVWRFGDGTPYVVTTQASISHTYTANGIYTASVTALDAQNESSPSFEMRVDVGNRPPTLAFVNEATTTAYAVKQPIHLQVSATDAEDGTVPPSAVQWRVFLQHVDQNNSQNSHAHPYVAPSLGHSLSFIMPPPEDLDAMNSYLEVQVSATDAQGLMKTITRTVQPQWVMVNLDTLPSGLDLMLNERTVTTPYTFTSWANYNLSLRAPASQFLGEQTAVFANWSSKAASAHIFNTPAQDTSLIAQYTLLPKALNKRAWLPALRR